MTPIPLAAIKPVRKKRTASRSRRFSRPEDPFFAWERRLSSQSLRVLEKHSEERPALDVGPVRFGAGRVVVLAGPCAVESASQMRRIAARLKELGVDILRGGAFKPRTSPYSFQGLGRKGLRILANIRDETGLPVCTEAVDTESFAEVEAVADLVQIGARNMQNFALLRRAGRSSKPVLLKRGPWATLEEMLYAAEYIAMEGNARVLLCERGIRTFAEHSRYTLDLAGIANLRRLTDLPVLADPSHSAGRAELVVPLALAAVAAGADGLLVEVHPNPRRAKCDGQQALTPAEFEKLLPSVRHVAQAVRAQWTE